MIDLIRVSGRNAFVDETISVRAVKDFVGKNDCPDL
jgi:hypothetical protein